jgi:hypothetical protein
MIMEELEEQLQNLVHRLNNPEAFREELESLVSVYPFSEYEYIISHLLASNVFTLDEYYDLRNSYIEQNLYLPLFEITAPRTFGEIWAQGHLKDHVPSLLKTHKKHDPDYAGQYDFFLPPDIRIEVKASRAVEFQRDAPLPAKALASTSQKQFDMNFQQIKPACCDVFVWIAVWRDVIQYWVLASHEVAASPYFSAGQHRGNVGEGQLHLNRENIDKFKKFSIQPNNLEKAIIQAAKRKRKNQ